MYDIETLRYKFETVGTAQVATAIRQMESVVTRAMGKSKSAIMHNERAMKALGSQAGKTTRDVNGLATALGAIHAMNTRVRLDVPDVTTEAKAVRTLTNALTKLQAVAHDASVRITVPNLTAEAKGINTLANALTKLDKLGNNIHLRVRVDALWGEILMVERLAASLRELRSRSVTVNVNQRGNAGNVGGDSGGVLRHAGALKVLAGAFVGAGRAATGAAAKVTLFAAVTAMATAATGALSVVLAGVAGGAATAAIAGIAGATLALASAAAVAGAGVAAFGILAFPTIKKVTDGFKDYRAAVDEATAAAARNDGEAFDKAMEDQAEILSRLSPAQQQVVQNLENLRQVWLGTAKALEPSVLRVFNAGIATTVGLMPALRAVAESVAPALEGLFEKMQAGIQGDQFKAFIDTVRGSAGELITQFGDIGFNVAGAFANGFTAGLPLISAVMDALVRNSDKLEEFFAGAGFKDFVDFGVQMLPELGELFGSLGRAVGALLKGLEPLAKVALDVLTGLGDGLTAAFSGPGMTAFVETVQTMLPLAGKALESLGGAFGALLDAVGPLGPVMLTVIGALGQALQTLFEGEAASQFIENLGGLLPMVVPILTLLAGAFLEVAAAVTDALLPVLPTLLEALETILPAFSHLVETLAGGLSAALVAVIPALAELLVAVEPLAAALITALVPVIDELAAALIESMPAFQDIITALIDALPAFQAILLAIIPLIPELVEVLVPAVQALSEALVEATPFLEWLAKKMEDWAPVIGDVTGFLVSLVTGLGDTADATQIAMDAIGNIDEAFRGFGDSLRGLPALIGDVFASAGTWLYDAGASILGGLIEGIRSSLPDLEGVLGWVTDRIPDWKGPAAVDADLLRGAGALMIGGLADQVLQSSNTVLKPALARVTGDIRGSFTPELAMAGVAGGSGGAGGTRTVYLPATHHTINGMTEASAPDGSLEKTVLRLMREHDEQLATSLNANQNGGPI